MPIDPINHGGERRVVLKLNEVIEAVNNPPAAPAPTTAQVSAALKAKTQINALTAVSTANATDEATAIALANANKTAINAIIAALKA